MNTPTFREVLRCAQPLFFEDGGEELIYTYGGTFFYVRFRGAFFAVTAKHCLYKRENKTIRLLRPDATKRRAFFSPQVVSVIDEPVCDSSDLAFIRIDPSRLSPEDKIAPWFLDFDMLSQFKTVILPKDRLGTKGCPKYAGSIDYDSGKIALGYVAWSGLYAGINHATGLHIFKFDALDGVQHFDGISGSPVFKIVDKPELFYWFAGVILQGTVESGLAYFVDSTIIFRALFILTGTGRRRLL